MTDLRLRHRARMREKDVHRINAELQEKLGFEKPPLPADVERAEATREFDLLIAGGRAVAIVYKADEAHPEERIMLTPRGLLANKPPKRYVTVDMGAVKFVNNGADVMAPGIVEADPDIAPGDFVWVRDERNKQPLAIGLALTPGAQMPRGPKGKAVKSLTYVGDEIWNAEA